MNRKLSAKERNELIAERKRNYDCNASRRFAPVSEQEKAEAANLLAEIAKQISDSKAA